VINELRSSDEQIRKGLRVRVIALTRAVTYRPVKTYSRTLIMVNETQTGLHN
jgi:hypothetical protein